MPSGQPDDVRSSRLRRQLSSPWLSATLFVLLLLSLSLHAWGIDLIPVRLDYERVGTWGDLIGALASAGAVIIAVASVAAERRRLREERAAIRSAEITQVYAWLEGREVSPGVRRWLLRFENNTRAPIYRWSVVISGTERLILTSKKYGPVRPGSTELRIDALGAFDPTREPDIQFEFEDADKHGWRVTRDGIRAVSLGEGEVA